METITGLPFMFLILCLVTRELLPNTDAQLTNCMDSDREALVDFKSGLHDPENRLSSWKGGNCCQWWGISCENTSGAVIAVDLHNPHPYNYGESTGTYGLWNLSGEIRPSLTKLKSLRHLDLSFNTFDGNTIPEFFGSLKSLQYLNLSNGGFSGAIPPNLGNLSSLQYLDVHLWGLLVNNLEWAAGLVSLKHLVMNEVDLSMVGPDLFRQLNKLPSLSELQLRNCRLSGSIPPPTFLNFTSLAVLDLIHNQFHSEIPGWLVNISSLVNLDISESELFGRIPLGFSDLPNLQFLYLGDNSLTASCHQLLGGRWRKIHVLDLSRNRLDGKLPASIGNLTFLSHLHLASNNVEGGIPSSIGNLCNLMLMDMSSNTMNGTLPEFLDEAENCLSMRPLPSLLSLELSGNHLVGNLPEWLGHLENLVKLVLSYNSLNGHIPDSFGSLQNLSRRPLPSLQSLDLSGNQLIGNLPEWLGGLKNLVVLSLSSNSLYGPIPTSFGILKQNLTLLKLNENELNGTLPESLGQLSELSTLDVSSNKLTGVVTEAHFLKLKKLSYLDLSSNSFKLNVSSNWVPPFQVSSLSMRSCHLGPSFPVWLKSQKQVNFLDFSNASLSGSIPYWFWEFSYSLSRLNLSFNQLAGQLPSRLEFGALGFPSQVIHLTGAVVDFSSNNFSGSIPKPSGINILDLSKNKLSGNIPNNISQSLVFLSIGYNQINGEIPASICNIGPYLKAIDLSNNKLTGSIPSSIGNCSDLSVLDISNNHLSGTIPTFLGQLGGLQTLHLNDNKLYGQLPSSFQNLSSLETLNLGNNRLSGVIPPWIGKGFESLRILSLRSNSFSGELPTLLSNLSALQILDLAENQLAGSIPPSFGHFKGMSQAESINHYLLYRPSRSSIHILGWENYEIVGSYYESYVVNMKGQPLRYTKTLSLVTVLDLSGNNLSGDLLIEITNLLGLRVIDLSRNQITGHIPESISKLKLLVSLDLSRNSFSGAIPQSLGTLSFLGYLNLSNNDLSGPIPYKDHMSTFDEFSFAGNLGLCGGPLAVKCPSDDDDDEKSDKGRTTSKDAGNGDSFIDKWFYLSIGLGFAAGILVPYLIMAMRKSWSITYFDVVDKVVDRMLYLWLKYRTTKQRTRGHQRRR
ncbi:receptor-like protein EIX2 isoform X1 [Ziziphus jujuba]|uniref:Receptor-like protein EIX2 isoform X1 n=1 Tax=Ziziphus jujuba TaxID=326968 RepID=A0A6P4A0Y8_ZIZJJ|nr:receptor-like protein EIX2 isoform X1 [Ziziphus jujuba]